MIKLSKFVLACVLVLIACIQTGMSSTCTIEVNPENNGHCVADTEIGSDGTIVVTGYHCQLTILGENFPYPDTLTCIIGSEPEPEEL